MSSSSSQPQTINISDLDLPQLADVKRQLEEEQQHLTGSFQQLKQAQSKFRVCLGNVEEIKPKNKSKTILVPLTNSLYVPGKLSDTEHVIVDVGTGYYVRMSRADAAKHYKTKIDYVTKNLETLQETLQKKQENLNMVVNIMQSKIQSAAASSS